MADEINKAVELFNEGKLREALGILSDPGTNSDIGDYRILQIAYDCLCGYDKFYRQLGINTEEIIEKSKEIVRRKFDL